MDNIIKVNRGRLWDVCIFAEGGRRRKPSDPDEINVNLPLKKGAFHILKELKYDLLIVKISGGNRLMFSQANYLRQGTFMIELLDLI